MGVINEQVITDFDTKYDYKKEGEKYFTKRKNSESWTEVKGSSLNAIKTKVFGENPKFTSIKDYGYSGKKDTVKSSSVEVPFKNREEGDKFRKWVNDNYPNYAKKIDLDKSGSHNNEYVKKAWSKYGSEYERKYIQVNPNNKNEEEGFFMNLLRKTFPFLVQLIYSKNLTNSDFSSDHFDVIKNVVKNAKKRISNFQYNKTYGTEYIDYSEYTEKILDTKGQSWWDLVKLYVWEGDNFEVATTLGRFSFKVSEDGKISIYDEYDFTKQYDITREDLDWENTNTVDRINKIIELGNGEIGLYGAIRHLAFLNNPQGGVNQSLTVNLTTEDPELANMA